MSGGLKTIYVQITLGVFLATGLTKCCLKEVWDSGLLFSITKLFLPFRTGFCNTKIILEILIPILVNLRLHIFLCVEDFLKLHKSKV